MWLGRIHKFWNNGFLIRSLILMLLCSALSCGCEKEKEEPMQEGMIPDEWEEQEKVSGEVWLESERETNGEKGYDLPVPEKEKEEAERECESVMRSVQELYAKAEKGDALNVVLPSQTIYQMSEQVAELGYSVRNSEAYSNMSNYRKFEKFLRDSSAGKRGSAVVYQINSEGGIGRERYHYDGKDMYVFTVIAAWGEENTPVITSHSYSRIKTWKYSKKGWFCYEYCVPEYPDVSEMVDGSCLIRVRPMSRKKRIYSQKFVQGLGYQGNNLLCSNWDAKHADKLDYNGMYEYFYEMKYKEKFPSEKYQDGIPRKEFEELIMEYLPVTASTIRKNAVYNSKKKTYEWMRLGCFNYALTFFGTSIPEVTRYRENTDGTITLTVDAVCEMVQCDEAVITHELTVREAEDGSFQYIGNRIKERDWKKLPDYEYRIPKSQVPTE